MDIRYFVQLVHAFCVLFHMSKLLLLVDGSSYLYRAYHALPDLRNAEGEPTGAIYGFLNMLHRLEKDYPTAYAACIFDAKGKTFRHDIYQEYKANRPAMPDDLARQTAPIHDLVRMLGWPIVSVTGIEADDVIGTLVSIGTGEGFDIVVSTGDKDLSQLVKDRVTLVNTMSRETVLRQYLSTVADRYDYALIDCMPSLGMLTINALTAADSVIIPVQAQYLPAKGLEQLLRTITRVKRQLNPKLEVDGILLTMVDSRTTLAREINALIRKSYGGHVFTSEIPRSIKAAEISVENKSIYDHDRSGKVAVAYENLTREVLSLGKQVKRHRTDPVR